jgi:hypothetical protein
MLPSEAFLPFPPPPNEISEAVGIKKKREIGNGLKSVNPTFPTS